MDSFKEITNLHDIVSDALGVCATGGEKGFFLNLSLKHRFPVTVLAEPHILDASEGAADWQSVDCPSHLYFSHGQYIGFDGLTNLISELRHKEHSNRAIISLINQSDIVGSGDMPIPSFMIFQCTIFDSVLFVTAYYRALEVSKFLGINVEELRLMIKSIYESLRRFDSVALHIFAFRAYVKENFNPLLKSELDRLDSLSLYFVIKQNPRELSVMLRDKARNAYSTISLSEPLRALKRALTEERGKNEIREELRSPRVMRKVDELIVLGDAINEMRKNTSHHNDIDTAATRFREELEKLARECDECLGP